MAGRPSIISDEITNTLATALRACVPIRWACELAGISHVTYYDWLARGEEWTEAQDADTPESEQPYRRFATTIRKARAEGLARPAAELYRLATDSSVDHNVRLRALTFLLTHADRDNWHPKQHESTVDDVVEVELAWE